jgi:ubiquinone/menaquinone biosynthesis C-methylase UbiE
MIGLNNEDRREWQNPEKILISIGLKKGYTFIDIGCGEGFFSIPAAKIVGSKGTVFGVDINDHSINKLNNLAEKNSLNNLILKVGKAEDSILCDRCGDIVFFGIDLHDFHDPMKVLVNAKRMMKPSGTLVDLDWKKVPMEIGPPMRIRFSKEKAIELIQKTGFRIIEVREVGLYHYLIRAKLKTEIS